LSTGASIRRDTEVGAPLPSVIALSFTPVLTTPFDAPAPRPDP